MYRQCGQLYAMYGVANHFHGTVDTIYRPQYGKNKLLLNKIFRVGGSDP